MPESNGVNSVPSKVMMMMTMMTISSTINHPSIIATLLMKVMTPFLTFPTTIMTRNDNLSSNLLCQEDEQSDSMSERQGNSVSEREGGSDEETNSASERDVGFDKETDSTSESADGSGIGASGSVDTNPGPVILPNDETAFSSTPRCPKDQADLVKLELVNLVLEIGAPLHLFHKIAQWAARATRANTCITYSNPMTAPITKLS
jgi:hypothetical protein